MLIAMMDSLSMFSMGHLFRNILILILLLIITKIIWERRHLIKLSMQLKGPSFFGSILVALEWTFTKDSMKYISKYYKKYSGMYGIWILHDLHVVVFEPEDVKEVFCNSISKPLIIAGPWIEGMGNGLSAMKNINENEKLIWKTHRNIILPFLTPDSIKHHFPLIRRTCTMLVEDVEKICNKELVDIGIVILRSCADIVSQSLFDVHLDFRNGKLDQEIEAMEIICMSIYERAVTPWFWIKPIYKLSNAYKVQQKATDAFFDFAKEVYKSKIQDHHKEKTEFQSPRIIDVLLKAKIDNKLSETEVLNEIAHVWGGAQDTTANTITHLIQLLAMNKICQDKVYQEIQNFFKNNDTIEWDDLDKFTYIDMCMKEALRLFPIGPAYYRYATKEFKLKSQNVTIPPGTHLLTAHFVTMRDPKYWDDPLTFNPERFSPEEVAKRHPFSYIPFGGGIRKCVGMHFAKVMFKLHIIYLLKNFEVHSDWKLEELPLSYDLDCRVIGGQYIKVTHRKKTE